MRLRRPLALLLVFALQACSDSQEPNRPDNSAALAAARGVVSTLKESLQIGYDLSAEAWDGTPMIIVGVDDRESDYQSVVGIISKSEAVQSFEGESRIAFLTQTLPPDPEQDPPFLGTKLNLGTFDAKTGARLQ